MKRLLTLALLLTASQARADETPAFSKTTALQAKLLTFLTGGQPPGQPNDAIPGLTQHESPPTWLVHWQSSLLSELQHPDLSQSHHPLLRATLQVVQLQGATKTAAQPILAAPLPVDTLACPHDAPVRVHVQVLHPGDDVTPPWLGVDIACVDAKPTLRRQVRLLVQATAQGQVQRAFGLAWTHNVPLTSQPESQATPEFVLHPTLLDKRFTWLVALPTGGWLAQVQAVRTGTWLSDNALPRFEDMATGDDESRDADRYTLLLAEDGTPRAALLHGPIDADGRLPLWREGAWDLALPQQVADEPLRTLILQRVAKPATAEGSHLGRAWTHAGYALWQVTRDAVQSVELPLAPLDQEGVWDCDSEPPVQRLLCVFRRLGPSSEATTEKRQFAVVPGPVAAFKLLPAND